MAWGHPGWPGVILDGPGSSPAPRPFEDGLRWARSPSDHPARSRLIFPHPRVHRVRAAWRVRARGVAGGEVTSLET
eukprot:10797660-Alexandrium_andersonii.AAC.1